MYLVFLMYMLFATIFVVGKVALHYSSPFFLTGVRMLLAGIILLSYQYIKDPSAIYIKKKYLLLLLLIGFFNVFLTNGLEFWGLQYMTSAKTCLIYSLSPFVAIIFSYFLLKEKMNTRKWIGLIIGILGFIPIYIAGPEAGEKLKSIGIFTSAEIAVTVSACSAVFGWIFIKKITKEKGYPILLANAFSFLIGGVMSIIISLIFEKWDPVPMHGVLNFILTLFYIAIIHNVICYSIYAHSLQKYTINFMTFAGITGPIFTAFFGWIFLSEAVGWHFFVSLLIIVLGLLIFTKGELNQIKIKK